MQLPMGIGEWRCWISPARWLCGRCQLPPPRVQQVLWWSILCCLSPATRLRCRRPTAPRAEAVSLAWGRSSVKTGNGCSRLDASSQGPCFFRQFPASIPFIFLNTCFKTIKSAAESSRYGPQAPRARLQRVVACPGTAGSSALCWAGWRLLNSPQLSPELQVEGMLKVLGTALSACPCAPSSSHRENQSPFSSCLH